MPRYFGDGVRDPGISLGEDCPWCGEDLEAMPGIMKVFHDDPKMREQITVRCSNRDCRFREQRPASDVDL